MHIPARARDTTYIETWKYQVCMDASTTGP